MTDSTSQSSNISKSKRYITIKNAALLAKTPESYIEHLCRESQLSHAFDRSGNFLPEFSVLAQILGLDTSAAQNIEFVNEDQVTNNENGLPEHWLLKTNRNSLLHHEDLPLFPVLKDKVKLEDKEERILLADKKVELLNDEEELLLQSPVIEDSILENIEPELIEKDNYVELESGKTSDDFLLPEGNELHIEVKQNITPIIDEKPQHFNVDSIHTSEQVKIEDNIIVKKEAPATKTYISPRNPNLIASLKVLPVPHFPISEAIKSDHPLAMRPVVMPISTHVPSLKTKVAAIYTQPDAMASKWLPWMRTSMWSKKMIRKAVHNIEIKPESSISIKPTQSPKFDPSPIFEGDVIQHSVQYIKPEIGKSKEKVSIEPPPPLVRMNVFSKEVKKDILVEPPRVKEEHPVIRTTLKIDDALDSAFFSDFAVDINKNLGLTEKIIQDNKKATVVPKQNIFKKPQINDSWDSAIFR